MSGSASNGDRDPATEKIHNDNRTCAVQLGPIQPSIIEFPQSNQGSKNHRFSKNWYNEFEWIEYSISQDKMLLFVFYADALARLVSTPECLV